MTMALTLLSSINYNGCVVKWGDWPTHSKIRIFNVEHEEHCSISTIPCQQRPEPAAEITGREKD